ncbi:TetR/AcrR family transcriptional regulator [Sphingosinicella microcystinivorans]|uniref:TetR/AcrR family transcriptional regulator n=1 Tax=Sphingosinicella microcystinivorans TaxID=335406 RepID=UPI0022F3A5DD|nr:TetR/AcrR family transcriptional regulator [Sphingosinicella microcystinivorans]WBX83046.1 TetR/AcrR family transcriptional regulator [Sphingosinicella microcystinivorans]
MEGDTSSRSTESGGRGRPVSLKKRRAVIAAAQRQFLRNGYAATSMDAVADAAGVSKLTVYNHFGSKAELFAAVIEAKCEEMFGAVDIAVSGADVRAGLIAVGHSFLWLVLDPDAVAAHNLIVQERERAPELGRLFYERAVLATSRRVMRILETYAARGDIRLADPQKAAFDLLSLLRAHPTLVIELGVDPFTAAELDAHIAHVVDLMLKAWR